ncbi:3-keto-disaccharide hydrolase [Anaerohalosphaeraceae bacterium U12dextr]
MKLQKRHYAAGLMIAAIAGLCCTGAIGQEQEQKKTWISLFNGKDLKGWTPKFTGSKLGENYKNTFRVEDGVLKVSYDQYEQFKGEFGHLFYALPFSHYLFRAEYRFTGQQVKGGPAWAFRNSGVMIHCQDPNTMTQDQDFPVSIEVQLLGGDGKNDRTTGNLCTPGTNVVINDTLITDHCITSKSKTYHGDQWVTIEIEVHGSDMIRHKINGETVIEYQKPQLDERDANAKKLIQDGKLLLSEGYIALQAESHPVEFRKVEILPLEEQ